MTQAIYVDTGNGLFADIFDRYRENGLEEAIQSSIHRRMQYCLKSALVDRMMSFKAEYGDHRDTDMNAILDSGAQSIKFNIIQIDLKNGATPTPFDLVFGQGLEHGRLNWRVERETLVLQPKYRDMATRDRYFFRQFGLIVDAQLFGWDRRDVTRCTCPLHLVQPVKRGMHSRPFMLWQCVFCGQPYVCICARGVPEIFQSTGRRTFADDMAAFDRARYRDGVCHLCRGISSTLVYRSRMYGSEILSRYEPYIHEHSNRPLRAAFSGILLSVS